MKTGRREGKRYTVKGRGRTGARGIENDEERRIAKKKDRKDKRCIKRGRNNVEKGNVRSRKNGKKDMLEKAKTQKKER
jgi:hypothetical protein